jgi:hypothetical protein
MIELANKKAGAWVKKMQTDMVTEILQGSLKNEKKDLEAYLLSKIKE